MRFRVGVVPPTPSPELEPGRFYFPQKLDTGMVMLDGSTTEQLIANVLSFRARFGLEIGDPAKEIDVYLCDKFPHLCHEFDPDVQQVADESPQADLTRRLTNWRANRYSKAQTGITPERDDRAQARAEICANCPARQEKPKEGCMPCIAENERVLLILRQGKEVTVQPGLCSVTGQDNETASFMTGDMLDYSTKYQDKLREANPHCWLLPESDLR